MAVTVRTDTIVPEILMEAVQGEFEGAQALMGSGAARVSSGLPQSQRGGDVIKIPYFDTLSDFEDVGEGNALTPDKIQMTSQAFPVKLTGKAFSITDWAQYAANYADPYGEAARQIRIGAMRRMDSELITVANAAVEAFDATDGTLDYDALVDAQLVFGDESGDLAALAIHSKVYGDLLKIKDGDGKPYFTDPLDAEQRRFAGLSTVVSDRNVVDTSGENDIYTSILAKRGAMGVWYRMDPLEEDRDILTGETVVAMRIYYAAGIYDRVAGGTKYPVVKVQSR